MRTHSFHFFVKALLVLCLAAGGWPWISPEVTVSAEEETVDVQVQPAVLPEADDFATQSFADAWDMNEFTDISQYLNGAGRHPSLYNIKVEDGLFSATSLGDYRDKLAYFMPIFPGHQNFIQVGGNLGSLQPINPNEYDCLYIAMRVASPPYKSGDPTPDGLRVLWYADKNMTPQGQAPNGGTNAVWFYPETIPPKNNPLVHNWKLFKVDLNNPMNGTISGGVKWQGRATWPGLQINPTLFKDIPFSIDWIRLTSCDSDSRYRTRLTWSPNSAVTAIWLRPSGTSRSIQVATGISGSSGSYDLDTKGLAPGTYKVGVGNLSGDNITWTSNNLTINARPIVTFANPSAYSGEDYATAAGNPWDITASDTTGIRCTQSSFFDGRMKLLTDYPAAQPANCLGPELHEVDSQIFLNMPAPLPSANQYRYLSFRMYMSGDLSTPADGMIGRWIWKVSDTCTLISHDIPYEVGWHTYSIDLYDPLNGTPIASTGCALTPWKDTGRIIGLRFDPNENWTGNMVPAAVFHQELDWIRLTKPTRVASGDTFPIRVTFNKTPEELNELEFFYTSDRTNPLMHRIESAKSVQGAPAATAGPYSIYLSVALRGGSSSQPAAFTYNWSTANIPSGEYYICVQAEDDFNESVFCSQAPLQVYNR